MKPAPKRFPVYPLSLLLALLTMALFYFTFGFFFEGYEKLNAAILYGAVTSPPTHEWFNETLFLQIPLIAQASSWLPRVPVYGIWHVLVMALYVSLWYFLCIRVLVRHGKTYGKAVFFAMLFVCAVIGPSLVYINFTRDSILLASVSLLLYLDYAVAENKNKWLFIALFLLGCSMRVSSGFLVLMALGLLYVLHLRQPGRVFRLLVLPSLLAAACLGTVMLNKRYSENTGLKIEQNSEYALCDRQAAMPMSTMTNTEDTMRYRALTEHFLVTDSAQITLDFINRVVDHDKYMAMGINAGDLAHLTETCLPLLLEHVWTLLALYLGLFVLAYGRPRRLLANLLWIHLFAWVVILGFGMKINMFNHFMEPWIAMLFGLSFWLLFQDGISLNFLQKTVAVLLPVAVIGLSWPQWQTIAKRERMNNERSASYMQGLQTVAQTHTPIIWVNQMEYLPSNVFARQETDVLKKCHYFSLYFMTYYPFAQDRCLQRFGFSPLDWRTMNSTLHANRESLRMVANDRMAHFLGEYYATLYGMEFILQKDFSQPELLPEIFVYTLNPTEKEGNP